MFTPRHGIARTLSLLCSITCSLYLVTSPLQFAHATETSSTSTSSKAVLLTVSGSDTNLTLGGSRHFKAKLGSSEPSGVQWSVNGIAGGDAENGLITAEGAYTAPALMPATNPITVLASVTVNGTAMTASKKFSLQLPKPQIGSAKPHAFKPGPYSLTITGKNFYPDTKLLINGVAVEATFVSETKMTTQGTAEKLGVLELMLVNPGDIHSASYKKVAVTADGKPIPEPTPIPNPTPTPAPAPDPKKIAAARFLEQASFGPTSSDMAAVMSSGPQAWITAQMALPASPISTSNDMSVLRTAWFNNMASGQDQLRQRMIFALSQLFVVSADKNNNANEMSPWLQTLSRHAFGNFDNLLREMTLNPAMGKYLDLGNSVTPAPNENYAREVMQLFTIGTVELNMDGSPKLDSSGAPVPTYDQARIGDMSRALSGWTYAGKSTKGLNWENFTGPLQARDKYHDKNAKTLPGGVPLAAGQTTQQDYDAVMHTLFQHPNLPPFIATRLIRHFVSSNPSPAYIERVATVFANGTSANNGQRGDLAATLNAVLMDPEARQDSPSASQGHLKDPILHSLGLIRVMGGKVVNAKNLFWDYYLLGQRLANSPSVFNFYSPLTHIPGDAQHFGPEVQIYAPSLAVQRANFIYNLLQGNYKTMVQIDIQPYLDVAYDPNALINLVDANLLQGRMSKDARSAIFEGVVAISDKRERAFTALYLSAISAEFAVHQ
ncbi:MAG: DUF1800 domain-containing protein [Burkholderiales bacterium]|nr:DUF1800 domain-containing protein [Burkholderiales bacterium]